MEDKWFSLVPRNFVKTKSTELILAPIANQIAELLLINEAYSCTHQEESVPNDLTALAQNLVYAIENLGKVATRLASQCDNDTKEKIVVSCDQLDLSSKNMLLASRNLVANKQKRECHIIFAQNTKELIESVYKVLLAADDVEVRKIVRTIQWIKDCISRFESLTTIESLVPAFKSYTEALVLLFNLLAKRQRDLKEEYQKEALGTAAIVLKKIAPVLNKAYQTSINYPTNIQANESKCNVGVQILQTLDDIADIVLNNSHQTNESSVQIGLFVHAIDQALDYLKETSKKRQLHDGEFDVLIETIVSHSMCVAQLTESPSDQRYSVVEICRKVLRLRSKAEASSRNLSKHREFEQLRQDFNELCHELLNELHELEKQVNALLVEKIVDTFKETIEPLDRLMRATLSKYKSHTYLPMAVLQPFYDDFSHHADTMYQVATFVADSSNDSTCVQSIRGTVKVLEKIDPDILPALLACQKNSSDDAALEVLRLTRQRWTREIRHLSDLIDGISDTYIFLDVTMTLLRKYAERAENSLTQVSLDVHLFADMARALTGLSNHLLSILNRHLNSSYDSDNKAHLNKACHHLTKVVSGVNAAANKLASNDADETVRNAFIKRTKLLIKCTEIIHSILNTEEVNASLETDVRQSIDKVSAEDVSVEPESEENVSEGARKWLSNSLPSHAGRQRFKSIDILTLSVEKISEPGGQDIYIDVDLNCQIEDLIESAIGLDKVTVDKLCSEVIKRSNHIIDISNSILPFTEHTDRKEDIQKLVSLVCTQTLELSSLAQSVCSRNISLLSNLQILAVEWMRNISMLEQSCDMQYALYKRIPDSVINACLLNNKQLLDKEMVKFSNIQKDFEHVLSMEGSEVMTELEKCRTESQELAASFKDAVSLDKKTGKAILDNLSRRWSAMVYVTIRRVCVFTSLYMKELHLEPSEQENADLLYSHCKRINAELTDMCDIVFTSERKAAQLKAGEIMSRLELLLDRLSHEKEAANSDVINFSELRLHITLTHWAQTVSDLYEILDSALTDVCRSFYQLATYAVQYCYAKDVDRPLILETYSNNKQRLRSLLLNTGDVVLKASKTCQQGDMVNILVRKMTEQQEQLFSLAQKLIERVTDKIVLEYRKVQRLWACCVLRIRAMLKSLPGIDSCAVREAEKLFEKITGLINAESDDIDVQHITSRLLGADNVLRDAVDSPLVSTEGILLSSAEGMLRLMNSSVKRDCKQSSTRIKLHKENTETSFSLAVKRFHGDLTCWMEDDNAVVCAAREMSHSLASMSRFTRTLDGPIGTRQQLFTVAQHVADKAEIIAGFARVISQYSLADKKFSNDLLYYGNQVPFYAGQLRMLATVKQLRSEHDSTVSALVSNAQNLMHCVIRCLKAAEVVCIKGLREPPSGKQDEQQIFSLATRWRGSLIKFRKRELKYREINELGLRVISNDYVGPQLSEICQ